MLLKIVDYLKLPNTEATLDQAQRLFHGRGHAYHGLNHITIDWLPPVVLITLFEPEPLNEAEKLADKLRLLLPNCQSIQLQHRYQRNGAIDVIWGKEINHLIIQENNLNFKIQLGKSRNTGLFLDMKNGRNWVQENSKGKRVLNLFSYTCGFSVAAIAGGAKSVVNIDMSSPALSVGRENHRLNHQLLDSVRFEKLNILKSFGRIKKRGPFDLLICDPPTFQKGSVDITKDYPKIIRRLNEFMATDSTLLLCLNAPDLTQDFLSEKIALYADNYKFHKLIKAPQVYFDAQGKGLKIFVFKS